jgi:FkbM family methyltransferase
MKKLIFEIYKLMVKTFRNFGLQKIGWIRRIHHFMNLCFKPNFVEIDGNKIFLDKKDALGLSIHKIHEPLVTDFIKKEVKDNFIVVDIGAHIGYYTLMFAKLVGENGKVFSFEPDPENFYLLKKNVEVNNYKNVVIEQKAVSDYVGKTKLFISRESSGQNTIYQIDKKQNFVEVNVVSLDEYFKNFNRNIHLIKMDIEGAEYSCLVGARNIIKKNERLKIITEFRPISLKSFGVEPEAFLKLLTELGFSLFEFCEDKQSIIPVTIEYLLKKYTVAKMNDTNLLCVKD